MTYCVGMAISRGLVLMSDTRTNAGVDNISTFRKMFHWEVPGERIIAIMTAGNLATTQSLISQLEERNKAPDERRNSLLDAPSMFQIAGIVGRLLRETIQSQDAENGQTGSGAFAASIIVAGQIAGMEPRMFLIYPEGNFIEASTDTPFFQIGETKYGRPILLRGYDSDMEFADAVKLMMVMVGALKQGAAIELEERGRVILSSLEYDKDSEKQFIHWQSCFGGLNKVSDYGDDGDNNGLNDKEITGLGNGTQKITAPEGSAVMFVEVFYEYKGVFGTLFTDGLTMKREAAFIIRDDRDLKGGVSGSDDAPLCPSPST